MAQTIPPFRFDYYPDDDMLSVAWSDEPSTHGAELPPSTILRFTDRNELVGVTVYDLSRAFPVKSAEEIPDLLPGMMAQILAEYARHAELL